MIKTIGNKIHFTGLTRREFMSSEPNSIPEIVQDYVNKNHPTKDVRECGQMTGHVNETYCIVYNLKDKENPTTNSEMIRFSDIIKELQQENRTLKNAITSILSLMDNSDGVVGLHQNGDVATWCELKDSWLESLAEVSDEPGILGERS